MRRLYLLTFCSVVLAAGIFFFKNRLPTTVAEGKGLIIPKEWLAQKGSRLTPQKDARPADQTFLTFPEWFLVFSPEEQADYFKRHTSTSFPFMSHTAQIWDSYKIVNDQVKDNFPTNRGYHFMIWVIGSSASVEYAVKAWYETIIGRITDTGIPLTEEDKFNARFTREYVDFIKEQPWYAFDFKSRLKTLWTSTPIFGENIFRKLDRRYILTSELLVKYLYGKAIGLGTKQVYEEALPTTAVILDNDSLKYLPRYDRFAEEITKLGLQGYTVKEVAGNRNVILVTLLVPAGSYRQVENTQTVFTQPVASRRTMERIALAVPVSHLSQVLLALYQDHVIVEHVFDY